MSATFYTRSSLLLSKHKHKHHAGCNQHSNPAQLLQGSVSRACKGSWQCPAGTFPETPHGYICTFFINKYNITCSYFG